MSPMCCAKRIVYKNIGQSGQVLRETFVIGFLAGFKTQVFQ